MKNNINIMVLNETEKLNKFLKRKKDWKLIVFWLSHKLKKYVYSEGKRVAQRKKKERKRKSQRGVKLIILLPVYKWLVRVFYTLAVRRF